MTTTPILVRTLLLAGALTAASPGEILEMEIQFESSGCIPCTESLTERLERIRGVDKAELNLEASSVKLQFAEGNRVRLAPLAARVTQDGTKIVEIRAVIRGVAESGGVVRCDPAGEKYRLTGGGKLPIESDRTYRFTGRLSSPEQPGEMPELAAEFAEPAK